MHLPVLCSHIYSMGKLIFLYPPHPLSQFGTHILCHCRVSLQSHCSCSDSSPPTEGMRASVGTYTLGQGVGENSALLFFFSQENFGVHFFPAGSTPQWQGGVVSALYVLQIRVQCCVHFFLGTLRDYYTTVCTCAHLRMCLLHCVHASSFALTL